MSKLAFLSSGTGVTVGAGVALVGALTVAAYVNDVFGTGAQSDSLQVAEPIAQTPSVAPEITDPVAQTELQAPRTASLVPVPKPPSFDVVRVETSGAAMIAGSADAGSTVEIRLEDDVLAAVKADSSGKFASFVSLPESDEAQILTLHAEGGTVAEEQVIIAPIVAVQTPVPLAAARAEQDVESIQVNETEPRVEIAEAAPLSDVPVVGARESDVSAPEPVVDTSPSIVAVAPEIERTISAPQAPLVLLSTSEGMRVLQAPDAPRPDAMTTLLGSIAYNNAGEVALTGRGGGDFVRVYLDNRSVATSRIAANGDWQADLPSVDTGIYTLRVDEMNAAGDVLARVETPFKREAADVLAAASKPEKTVQAITVQPGATLWAIALERYGSGIQYTRVFEANLDAIKDPDLIYPGQVFTVPN